MIVKDLQFRVIGFCIMTLGILIISFANFFIEEMKGFYGGWRKVKNLDEAIREFNIFVGATLIVCGLFCIDNAKANFSRFDEIISTFLLLLIFGGLLIFIIYFNLRFVIRGK